MHTVLARDIPDWRGGVGERDVHGVRGGQVLGCPGSVRPGHVPRLCWRDLLYDGGGGDRVGLHTVRRRHVLDRVGCKGLGRLCSVRARVVLGLTWIDRMHEVRGRDVPVWIGGVGERCVRWVLGGHVLDRHRHVSVRQLCCWEILNIPGGSELGGVRRVHCWDVLVKRGQPVERRVHTMRRWHLLDRDSGGRRGDVWKVRRRQVLGYHRGTRRGGMRGLRSREVLDGIGRD